MKNNTLEKLLSGMGIEYKTEFLEKLEHFYFLLSEKNKFLNLTAITEYDDVMRKHFADSLAVLKYQGFLDGQKVLDLGTGGGFPGIPLKIFLPDVKFVLMDSVRKKLSFIDEVIRELGLKSVSLIHGRAEDLAQTDGYREQFDFVLSRAVSNLSTLSELSLPFVKLGGKFISYKGESGNEELLRAGNAISLLGGRTEGLNEYELPGGDRRSLIFIKKEKRCPDKYPRRAGTPAREPL